MAGPRVCVVVGVVNNHHIRWRSRTTSVAVGVAWRGCRCPSTRMCTSCRSSTTPTYSYITGRDPSDHTLHTHTALFVRPYLSGHSQVQCFNEKASNSKGKPPSAEEGKQPPSSEAPSSPSPSPHPHHTNTNSPRDDADHSLSPSATPLSPRNGDEAFLSRSLPEADSLMTRDGSAVPDFRLKHYEKKRTIRRASMGGEEAPTNDVGVERGGGGEGRLSGDSDEEERRQRERERLVFPYSYLIRHRGPFGWTNPDDPATCISDDTPAPPPPMPSLSASISRSGSQALSHNTGGEHDHDTHAEHPLLPFPSIQPALQFPQGRGWRSCSIRFSQQGAYPWNNLDPIVCLANLQPPTNSIMEHVKGWELRIRTQAFVLVPNRLRSHYVDTDSTPLSDPDKERVSTLLRREDELTAVGCDPFTHSDSDDVDQYLVDRARQFFASLQELCFKNAPAFYDPSTMGLRVDFSPPPSGGLQGVHLRSRRVFTCWCEETVWHANELGEAIHPLPSEWFMFHYDGHFTPPLLFRFTIEWLVCSSIFIAKFMKRLRSLATQLDFAVVQLPMAQIFPANERKRPPFNPMFTAQYRLLNGHHGDETAALVIARRLLYAFLDAPLNMLVVAGRPDSVVHPREDDKPGERVEYLPPGMEDGWVLMERHGLYFVHITRWTCHREQRVAWLPLCVCVCACRDSVLWHSTYLQWSWVEKGTSRLRVGEAGEAPCHGQTGTHITADHTLFYCAYAIHPSSVAVHDVCRDVQ